jgi:PAS domain S-box-containing protein
MQIEMKKIIYNALDFINPVSNLGSGKYSALFPLATTLICCTLIHAIYILGHYSRDVLGLMAIFIPLALIIYFSFRDGLRGAIITTTITIGYYIFLIYNLNYQGDELTNGIRTTAILAVLYYLVGCVIGWLKETIDKLIIKEADARRRLETIVEQLPVGVIIADRNGQIIKTNKRIENMAGAKIPSDFLIGKTRYINYLDGDKDLEIAKYPLIMALKGKGTINRELGLRRKNDNRVLTVKVNATPIKGDNGKIIAAASIITDITQQKLAEKRKDDFINMASHELKTPVTSMNLYVASLLGNIKNTNNPKALKTINSIKNQTKKLEDLIDDLLDVTRLNTGKLTFNLEKFNIDDVIEETIDSIKDTTRQKLIFGSKSKATVNADKFRVSQVITNFLTNAIKYSRQEGNIVVSSKKSKGQLVVSVQDSGIGIQKDELTKIFDRLYQVDGAAEKTYPGLGMGLFISREIIIRHKGKIWAESTLGKGSTFYFSLPL